MFHKSILLILIGAIVFGFFYFQNESNEFSKDLATASPSPSPPVFPYSPPTVAKNEFYRIMLVGDSMTRALGPNANALRLELIERYPDSEFVTYNYALPATNIETLPDRLQNQTVYDGETYYPILSQGFDLIIIESFAYNPLSEYSLSEGLKIHTELVSEAVEKLAREKPEAPIALMATIAPNETEFAAASLDLSPEVRAQWVKERVAYMNAHINFANEKNIPLINVYEKSLNESGQGDLRYINATDNIHPSEAGIALIAETIADYIFDNKIFPE